MKRIRQRLVRSGGDSQMMWVVRLDEGGDGRTKVGMAGRRWGRPDEGGDGWMKVGTAGQRWGQPDGDGDEP